MGQRFDFDSCAYLAKSGQDSLLEAYLKNIDGELSDHDQVVYHYYSSLFFKYSYDVEQQFYHLLAGEKLIAEKGIPDSIRAKYLDEFALLYRKEESEETQALKYIDSSIHLKRRLKNHNELAKGYLIKGNIFYTFSNAKSYLDSAFRYYTLAKDLNTNEDLNQHLLMNIATVAIDLGLDSEVEKTLKSVHRGHSKNGQHEMATNAIINLANYYIETGDTDKAAGILDTLLDHAAEYKLENCVVFILRTKAGLAASLNDFKSAAMWKDSIINYDENAHALEIEDAIVKFDKLTLEKELLAEQAKIYRNRLWLSFLGGLSFLLALLGLGIYRYQRLKKLAVEKELETTKVQATLNATKAKMEGEQKERQAIASILHDQVASLLTAADMHLKVAGKQASNLKSLDKAEEILKDVNAQVRDLSHQLVSPSLMKFGLESAIEALINRLDSRAFVFFLNSNLGGKRFEQNIEIFIYNSCSELMHNTLKHSSGNECFIRMEWVESIFSLEVRDNGINDNDEEPLGLGLVHITNRTEALGGSFDFMLSREGAMIKLQLPLSPLTTA